MNRYMILLTCFSIFAAEKELPKPMVIPREVIIYPPTTPQEFLERRRILTDALTSPTLTRIIVKDRKPQDKASK